MEQIAERVEVVNKSYIIDCINTLHKKETLFDAFNYAIDFYGYRINIGNSNLSNSLKYSTDYPSLFTVENFLIDRCNNCEVKYDRNRYNSITLFRGTDRLFVFDLKNNNLGCDYEFIWSVLLYQYNCSVYHNSNNPHINTVIVDFFKKYFNITGFRPMCIQSYDQTI